MGKVKRRTLKYKRYSPLSNTSRKPNNKQADNTMDEAMEILSVEEVSVANTNISGLQSILNKLSNNSLEDKVTSLNLLSSLAEKKKNMKPILESAAMELVVPLVLYNDKNVQYAALGAISNLLEFDLDQSNKYKEAVLGDLMDKVCSLLKSFEGKALHPMSEDSGFAQIEREEDPSYYIFQFSVELLTKLCTWKECMVKKFNEENMVSLFMQFLDPSKYGFKLSHVVLYCLLCATEDNETAAEYLIPRTSSLISSIVASQQESYDWVYYSILISGVLANCSSEFDTAKHIIEFVNKTLEVNLENVLSKDYPDNNLLVNDIICCISAQETALEILTNLCCTFEDYSSDYDSSDYDSPDSNPRGIDDSEDTYVSPEVINLVTRHNLAQKVFTMAVNDYTDKLDRFTSLKKKKINERLLNLKIKALQCMQNLTSCMCIEELGGSGKLYELWIKFGTAIVKCDKKDDAMQEALSGGMRSTLNKLCSENCNQLIFVPLEDIENILNIANKCEPTIKANLVRMVTSLCCYIIHNSDEEQIYEQQKKVLFSAVTQYLLEMANSHSELWVCCEALDAIMDLYSDDKTDRLAADLSLVESLQSIGRQFKHKYQKHRRKPSIHRPLITTVKDNLPRFITYKLKRLRR